MEEIEELQQWLTAELDQADNEGRRMSTKGLAQKDLLGQHPR